MYRRRRVIDRVIIFFSRYSRNIRRFAKIWDWKIDLIGFSSFFEYSTSLLRGMLELIFRAEYYEVLEIMVIIVSLERIKIILKLC